MFEFYTFEITVTSPGDNNFNYLTIPKVDGIFLHIKQLNFILSYLDLCYMLYILSFLETFYGLVF